MIVRCETLLYLVFVLGLAIVTKDASGQLRLQNGRRAGNIFSRSRMGGGTCTTPSSKSGNCIPMMRCRSFWGKNLPDLTNSSCGVGNMARVCCPLAEEEESTITSNITSKDPENFPTTPAISNDSLTALDANSTDKGRRNGMRIFPENCGQSGATFRRIIGGQESVLGAWPWMAVVYIIRRNSRSPECGGVLITSTHVLTAAHCIITTRRGTTLNPRQLLVRLGELNLDSDNDGANPIDIKIRSVIKHARFSLRTFQNDIAILELVEPVEMNDHIAPICLPFNSFSEDELEDRNAIAAGWGSTKFGGPGSSALQEVQLRIWNNAKCKEVFRRDVPITQVNLCAGDGDKDACRGDSGGPLMLVDSNGKFNLIGIVSFGRKCAEPGIPGVYTRVTAFLDWIEEKIG